MAEGTSTWEGGGLPLLGEYEQVAQTAANDIVTLTGATSHSGDFIVMQNSTGAELAYVDINGGAHFAGASSFASTVTITGALTLSGSVTGTQHGLVVSATTMVGGVLVSMTSTGAIADGSYQVNGVVVQASSKSVTNHAFLYNSAPSTNSDQVGSCNILIGSAGSKAPTYFLSVGSTEGPLKGAHAAMGFLDDSLLVNTFTCDHPFVGIKCTNGSAVFYMLGVRATGIT